MEGLRTTLLLFLMVAYTCKLGWPLPQFQCIKDSSDSSESDSSEEEPPERRTTPQPVPLTTAMQDRMGTPTAHPLTAGAQTAPPSAGTVLPVLNDVTAGLPVSDRTPGSPGPDLSAGTLAPPAALTATVLLPVRNTESRGDNM